MYTHTYIFIYHFIHIDTHAGEGLKQQAAHIKYLRAGYDKQISEYKEQTNTVETEKALVVAKFAEQKKVLDTQRSVLLDRCVEISAYICVSAYVHVWIHVCLCVV